MHPTRRRAGRTTLAARTLTVLPLAALVLLSGCGAASPPPPPPTAAQPAGQEPADLTRADVDAWLDGYVPAVLDREDIPGASVAVVHDGEVVTARGFGWADREQREPVDPEQTLFRVGSVSKVFTATAVMQLVEQGEVDLDAPVSDYVDVDLERPVTLRHLLSHTGGFEEKVEGLIQGPDAEVDLGEALTTDPPEQIYEPGTVPAYSNYGNALAGLVVEEVSGEPFEEYLATHVLAPAGMASSSFAQPLPPELADRLALGYPDATSAPVPFEVVGTPPAGALTSSAHDMAGFMLAHLGDGARLLEPATREQMQSPALGEESLGALAGGPRMTLGFFDRSRHGHRALEHGGDTTVFHADLELWPDDGTGIFVALNGSGSEAMSTARAREGLLDGFADRYLPGEEPTANASGDDRAQALAGTYESSRTVRSNFLAAAFAPGQTTVEPRGDGRLVISPGPNADGPVVFEEVEPWVWREVGGAQEIAARVDADGEVEAIGFDNAFALLPVPWHRTTAVLAPVLAGSALVLLLGTIGWVLARPVRWVRRSPGRGRQGRVLRVLSRVGVASATLALVGWGILLSQVMGLGTPVSTTSIRVVQALQLLGLVAVVPALLRVADEARRRTGWRQVVAGVATLVALAGLGWVAVTLRLLSPDISY